MNKEKYIDDYAEKFIKEIGCEESEHEYRSYDFLMSKARKLIYDIIKDIEAEKDKEIEDLTWKLRDAKGLVD